MRVSSERKEARLQLCPPAPASVEPCPGLAILQEGGGAAQGSRIVDGTASQLKTAGGRGEEAANHQPVVWA